MTRGGRVGAADRAPAVRPVGRKPCRRALRAVVAAGLAAWLLVVRAAPALACPVCFGDPNNAQTRATRAAVLFLLGLTTLVVVGVARLFIRIARHAREAGRSAPPPADRVP